MTDHEALEVISRLVALCGTWDEAAVITFRDEVAMLGDVDAAHAATEAVIATWTDTRRPPFAKWREAYLSAVRRGNAERRALPSPGHAIPLTQYLDGLRRDAERDAASRHELDAWERVLGRRTDRPLHPGLAAVFGWVR